MGAATLLAPPTADAGEANPWTLDASLYGLAAGMSGNVGIGRVNADVDFGFDKVWDNLEFAMMGKIRVGYDRWALSTDVVYMGLGASKNGVSVDLDHRSGECGCFIATETHKGHNYLRCTKRVLPRTAARKSENLKLAERGGFEPPVGLLTLQRFSKPPPSATRPPLPRWSG